MIAVCVDRGHTTTLEVGKQYFIFPNGLSHVYVAKRNNKNAHFGCFTKSMFREVEQAPKVELENEGTYKAVCATAPGGYAHSNGKTLYFKPTHSKKYVYWYHDKQMTALGGCYALEWFINVEQYEIEALEEVQEQEVPEPESKEQEILPANEWEQLKLF